MRRTQIKDLRAVFRREGLRERAAFRARGYRWLATSCSVGLIIIGAANALQYSSLLTEVAVIAVFIVALASLRVGWYSLDRYSLAAENFNVYHYGFGHSYVPFEIALENFRLLDAKSYAIASRRLRARHQAASIKHEREMESYVVGMRRILR